MRNDVSLENIDQLLFFADEYIRSNNKNALIDLISQMFNKNIISYFYQHCIEFYLYHCCIFNPEFLSEILSFKHNLDYYINLGLHLCFTPKQYLFNYLHKYYYR